MIKFKQKLIAFWSLLTKDKYIIVTDDYCVACVSKDTNSFLTRCAESIDLIAQEKIGNENIVRELDNE